MEKKIKLSEKTLKMIRDTEAELKADEGFRNMPTSPAEAVLVSFGKEEDKPSDKKDPEKNN